MDLFNNIKYNNNNTNTNIPCILKLIMGPMRSRKTTELINEIFKYNYKYDYLIFNNNKDTRCNKDEIKTHNNMKYKAIKINKLSEIYENEEILNLYKSSKIIGIDESQFFPDLVEFILNELSNSFNKIFIVSGLDCDYLQKFWNTNNNNNLLCNGSKWGDIVDLIPHADSVIRLSTHCSYGNCYYNAPYTVRIDPNKKDLLLIDDNEYVNLCRKHYNIFKNTI
jgi:thymidine kinase